MMTMVIVMMVVMVVMMMVMMVMMMMVMLMVMIMAMTMAMTATTTTTYRPTRAVAGERGRLKTRTFFQHTTRGCGRLPVMAHRLCEEECGKEYGCLIWGG